jgi:hypothetical protein
MGNARWDATDWGTYATAHVTGKPAAAVFTSRDLKDAYNPAKIAFRESRDSAMNPLSTPIILASDVTGSMGMISHKLMQDGLNTLATGIYDRKPVTDPHIMVLAIGDAEYDRAPLQATQFEADITLADQVRDLWIEGGGGANGGESYSAAHLFAALKTRTDAAEKRGRKGYLFTIGDEPNLDGMRADQIKRVFGETEARDLSARDCLAMAERDYEVFHIILANEGYARHGIDRVLATWKPLLPERTILLEDVSMLAETVISTIQVIEGASAADVVASWSGSTAVVVANALRGLPARSAGTGLRRL